MEKKCSKCGEEKELTEFRKENTKDGRGYYCKECCRKIDKENRKNRTPEQIEKERNQNKINNQKRKERYKNLTVVPYNFECSEQDGLDCKRCGKFFPHHCFKIDTRFERGYSKKCITCLGDFTQNIKKMCSKCGEEKYLHQFRKDGLSKDGRTSNCCECVAEKERELHKIPEVREKNKNKCSTYRQNHYDYDIKRCQDYKEENKEDLDEYSRKYHIENAEIIKERKNTPEAKQKRKDNKKRRLKEDQQYYLREKISTNVRTNLKIYSSTGKSKSCKLYGIDIEAIFNHIGPKPLPNYTLDHIVPCKSFDLNIPEHIRLCYCKENLRWCLDLENFSKNDEIVPKLIREYNLEWLCEFLDINLTKYEYNNTLLDKYNKQEE